jgi:integrase
MQINEDRLRQPGPDVLVADLVDHYVQTELSEGIGRHSHATRIVHRQFLKRWIRPHWGKVSFHSVRTMAVERWLRGLQRVDGTPLASATKAKIRNLLRVLFNHAIRYEWLGQGRNPIAFVRQSAKRMRIPEVLEPSEIQGLLLHLKSCFRLMVLLDVTTGLRRSELFALKWSDVDFSNMRLDVMRSIYLGHIGDCKTEASRKPVPLDDRVAADPVSATRQLDIRESAYSREASILARCLAAKDHSSSGIASWDRQENWVAYISTHILDSSDRQRGELKGGSGIDASC